MREHSATEGGVPSATARQRLAVASALAQSSITAFIGYSI